jgi:CheY-like chemotaxis protein
MILIVDDDPINARVLRQLLERLRFTPHLVPTGVEALAFLAESPVDLIICSLVLPDMDGFTLLSQIMDRPYLCDVPVMVCTGTVDPTSVSRAVAVGAADVVMKPVRPEAFAARLERVLRRAPLRWEARSTVVRRLRMNSHDFHALLEMASGQLDHLLHALDEALNIVGEYTEQTGAPGQLAVSEGEALEYLVGRMRDAALYVGALRCASMLGKLQPPVTAGEQDILTLREAMRVERASFNQALATRGASLPRVFAAY